MTKGKARGCGVFISPLEHPRLTSARADEVRLFLDLYDEYKLKCVTTGSCQPLRLSAMIETHLLKSICEFELDDEPASVSDDKLVKFLRHVVSKSALEEVDWGRILSERLVLKAGSLSDVHARVLKVFTELSRLIEEHGNPVLPIRRVCKIILSSIEEESTRRYVDNKLRFGEKGNEVLEDKKKFFRFLVDTITDLERARATAEQYATAHEWQLMRRKLVEEWRRWMMRRRHLGRHLVLETIHGLLRIMFHIRSRK
eukprot:Rmarinus@m.18700